MSDASPSNSSENWRPLRVDERELLVHLLRGYKSPGEVEAILAEALVSDMNDGGMGSILFRGSKGRSVGKVIAEAGYQDVDDVLVSIVVNLDKDGQLFELDMWKVDFSALKRYPRPSQLLPA